MGGQLPVVQTCGETKTVVKSGDFAKHVYLFDDKLSKSYTVHHQSFDRYWKIAFFN